MAAIINNKNTNKLGSVRDLCVPFTCMFCDSVYTEMSCLKSAKRFVDIIDLNMHAIRHVVKQGMDWNGMEFYHEF